MAYINPWDLLARRASGSRDPASVKDIPFAGSQDELSSQLPMINAIAGPMSPYGYEVSIGKGGKTPLPKEKVAEILASVGYNPEAESAQAQAHIEAMKNYEQAIASRPPQMDLSGLAAMSQYYNQDKKLTPYEKPADYQDQLVQAAKVQQLIGDARQKDAERKAQLLKAVSEFAPSEQALKFNRKGPPGGSQGLNEKDKIRIGMELGKRLDPTMTGQVNTKFEDALKVLGTFDPEDNTIIPGFGQNGLGMIQRQIDPKARENYGRIQDAIAIARHELYGSALSRQEAEKDMAASGLSWNSPPSALRRYMQKLNEAYQQKIASTKASFPPEIVHEYESKNGAITTAPFEHRGAAKSPPKATKSYKDLLK